MGVSSSSSPKWSTSAKLLAGLVMLVVVAYFFSRFTSLRNPFIAGIHHHLYPAAVHCPGIQAHAAELECLGYPDIPVVHCDNADYYGADGRYPGAGDTEDWKQSLFDLWKNSPSCWINGSGMSMSSVFGNSAPEKLISEYQIDLNEVSSQIISNLQPLFNSGGRADRFSGYQA